MEKNREVRRASMSTRRRHRITSLRDSSGRDREVLNENKRMRVERFAVQKRCSREEKEEEEDGDVESTDESFNNEEEDGDRRISPSSSSISNNHRRYITPSRGAVRSPSLLRITDEMVIGVPVPRKARSASAKRSHENWSFFEHQSHRKFSPVTVDGGLDGASRSSSSGSLRNKKMKSRGIKTRFRVSSTSTKSSSLIQDDIEIEVAEALFDLMKQSQSHSQSKSESSDKAADDKSYCSLADIVGANGKDVENGKEAVSIQNGLITEIKTDNEEVSKMGMERCLMEPKSVLPERIIAQKIELKKEESVVKEKDSNDGSVGGDMVVTKEEEESRPRAKSNADKPVGSASSKANSAAKVVAKKREAKFEIDLMAPLMPLSPVRDGLIDHPQIVVQDVQMKSEMVVKNEDKLVEKGQEEKKMETRYTKQGSSKLDLEMAYLENVGSSNGNKAQQEGEKEPNQCQAPISPGGQKFDQPSSLPFPIAGTGWPTGLPHPGYMPPFPVVMPVDGSARSLTALQQPPPFLVSKPRPKRCVTHQYIARNIRCHQQLNKNSMWPAAGAGAGAGASTLIEAKPHNLKPSLSAQNVTIGKTSQRDFPGWQTLAMISDLSGKDKSSGTTNNVDATNGKQLMLQQGPQQVPTANMLHGQAMIFQLGQHRASTAPPTNQPGPPKSAPAVGKAGMPSNSSGRAPVSSSASPAGTAAVNFTHANMTSNAAPPYMAMFHNNGYPFSFSTNVGVPPSTKGGAQAPLMPFLNGSYYSSPVFHISQSQPQQSRSQSQVKTSPHSASTSSGLPSSQVQLHGQPQMGAQINQNTYFAPMSMLLQQSEKQQAPPSSSDGKPAAETNQKNDALIADSQASPSQKSNNSQNFVVPMQQINLAYMTPRTLGGNMGATSSNHSEQQQQQQQGGSKGGYQLMPPQAFGLSFSSTASTTPALNFSSMAQNPTVFQMLPDIGRQIYQFAPGSQMTQHKNLQMSEGKIIVGSVSNTEERKGILGNSHASAGQSRNGSKSSCTEPSTSALMGTAVIDSSGRTVSFVQLPVSGSQTFPSSSTFPTAVVSANNSNFHQQQLIHLQKQHQQMQMTGNAQYKETNSNALPCAFITTHSPNNNPVFSQTPVQTSSSAQSSPLNYLHSSQVSSPFNSSSLKDICQQQLNHPQSQTHIAFGSSTSNVSTAFQGQQFVINNRSAASLVGESPSNSSISKGTSGNSNTAPTGSKSGPTSAALPSQQIETSRSTPSQKSSPVCGRNVPSIVSTCSSQLPELKY